MNLLNITNIISPKSRTCTPACAINIGHDKYSVETRISSAGNKGVENPAFFSSMSLPNINYRQWQQRKNVKDVGYVADVSSSQNSDWVLVGIIVIHVIKKDSCRKWTLLLPERKVSIDHWTLNINYRQLTNLNISFPRLYVTGVCS